jgi:hypothetical protein
MVPRTDLVGVNAIYADHPPALLGNVGSPREPRPLIFGLPAGNIPGIGIGIPRRGDLMKDKPDVIEVSAFSFSHFHRGVHPIPGLCLNSAGSIPANNSNG